MTIISTISTIDPISFIGPEKVEKRIEIRRLPIGETEGWSLWTKIGDDVYQSPVLPTPEELALWADNNRGKSYMNSIATRSDWLKSITEYLPQRWIKEWMPWECVMNIANALTSQLYLAEWSNPGCIDPNRAHICLDSKGGRKFKSTDVRIAGEDACTRWMSLGEDGTTMMWFQSASSGNELLATKHQKGWSLEYTPDKEVPGYRGKYYEMWLYPIDVQPLRIEKIRQTIKLLAAPDEYCQYLNSLGTIIEALR